MKGFTENLKLALGTITTHKMRSALTVLGVVIGVTCVIAIGSILTGMNAAVTNDLRAFGTDNIFVHRWSMGISFGRRSREERMRKPLSREDFEAARDTCTSCKQMCLTITMFQIDKARYKGQELQNIDFHGDFANYPDVWHMPVGEGRFFTDAENEHRSEVAVIGADVKSTFFPHTDAIGKQVEVNGHMFTVIGVMEKRVASAFGDSSQDSTITIPYETYHKIYPMANEHFIVAQAFPGRISEAMDQIRAGLRRSRRVPLDKPDSFDMATADSIIDQFHQITGAIALVMVVISSIGLLVGGVGVMNIMLVSVTERTREIGVRKAIGARRMDIILQFLLEACTLTGFGGVMGIVLGSLISFLLKLAMPKFPTTVPFWAVAIGFAVSVSVGVFFGMWPAVKAARLDPVEALRYE